MATVYKSFGTKAAIARELNDLIDEEAGTAGLAAQADAETDPARLIGLAVAQLRTQHERCGDIISVIRCRVRRRHWRAARRGRDRVTFHRDRASEAA